MVCSHTRSLESDITHSHHWYRGFLGWSSVYPATRGCRATPQPAPTPSTYPLKVRLGPEHIPCPWRVSRALRGKDAGSSFCKIPTRGTSASSCFCSQDHLCSVAHFAFVPHTRSNTHKGYCSALCCFPPTCSLDLLTQSLRFHHPQADCHTCTPPHPASQGQAGPRVDPAKRPAHLCMDSQPRTPSGRTDSPAAPRPSA